MLSLHDLLTRKLAEQTGFPVVVGKAKANPLTGRFSVENLEIRNPKRYTRPVFLVAPEVRGHASPTTLLSRDVKIRELSVHLGRLTGIRSETGKINIAEFRRRLEERDEERSDVRDSRRRVTIGQLRLKLDTVEVADYAEELGRREYSVSIDETFSDVTDPILLAPFFVEAFAAAGLSQAENPIFASFLPDLLWLEIRAILRPSLAHLIGLAQE